MITITSQGDWKRTTQWFKKARSPKYRESLQRFAYAGLDALRNATPVDSGETAAAWGFEIVQNRRFTKIVYTNSNNPGGAPIAVMLQYGHGTGSGGWVQGRDYINPATRRIFDKMADDAWKELTRG